jgi:hypothetical protein
MPPPTIDHDLPCALCDYNLKGLSPDANCPECGQPISRTFTYDLTWADPAWLRRQAKALPLLGALVLLTFQTPDFISAGFYRPVATFVAHGLYGIAALAAAWACFRLAAPDPAFPADPDGTYRRGLQLSTLLLLALTLLNLPPFRRFDVLPTRLTLGAAAFVRILVLAATELLALLLVARLARRSKDPSLQRWAGRLRYAFPAIPLVQNVAYVVDVRPIAEAYYVFTLVLYWASPAVAYATLVLLGRLTETLRLAATAAESRGAQSPPQQQPHSPLAPDPVTDTLSPPREELPGPTAQEAP